MAGLFPDPVELNVPEDTDLGRLKQLMRTRVLERVARRIKKAGHHGVVMIDLDDIMRDNLDIHAQIRAALGLDPDLEVLFMEHVWKIISPVEVYALLKKKLKDAHPLYNVEWLDDELLISWVQ
jgi:hypothetical protein